MTENDTEISQGEGLEDKKQGDTRTPRMIRFSDSEWEEVKTAAGKQEITAAEFIRDTVLDLARSETGPASTVIPPGLVALIEGTYRNAYILATLKRDEMRREGRAGEMDEMVKTARAAQAQLFPPS